MQYIILNWQERPVHDETKSTASRSENRYTDTHTHTQMDEQAENIVAPAAHRMGNRGIINHSLTTTTTTTV